MYQMKSWVVCFFCFVFPSLFVIQVLVLEGGMKKISSGTYVTGSTNRDHFADFFKIVFFVTLG